MKYVLFKNGTKDRTELIYSLVLPPMNGMVKWLKMKTKIIRGHYLSWSTLLTSSLPLSYLDNWAVAFGVYISLLIKVCCQLLYLYTI